MTTEEPMLTYDPARTCPKCEHRGDVRTYSATATYARSSDGQLICVGRFADPLVPHLVIRCIGCGWEWITETKDATSGADQG